MSPICRGEAHLASTPPQNISKQEKLNSDHFYAQGKRGRAKRPGRAGAGAGAGAAAAGAAASALPSVTTEPTGAILDSIAVLLDTTLAKDSSPTESAMKYTEKAKMTRKPSTAPKLRMKTSSAVLTALPRLVNVMEGFKI